MWITLSQPAMKTADCLVILTDHAVHFAREHGALTVGFVGYDGGQLKDLVDLCVHIENDCMAQVEDIHAMLGHLITTVLRQRATSRPSEPETAGLFLPFRIKRFEAALSEGD